MTATPPPKPMVVEVLTGPPGCGKSHRMREEAIAQPGLYVFLMPTIGLLEEQVARFRAAAPQLHLYEAHSKSGKITVQRKLDDARTSIVEARLTHAVIYTTHDALISRDLSDFTGWHARVDEAPNATASGHVNDEVEAVIEHCLVTKAAGLARAVALGRYAGLRRQSICSIRECDRLIVTGADGRPERRLKFRSEKAEEGVDVREDPRLTELLDTTQSCGEILSFNKRGRPWAPRQLNQALTRVIGVLVELGEVRADLTLHGLRHSRGVELAHAGATDAQLAAHLGHRDEQTAREYRRQASKSQLADGAQDMVDQALRACKRSG